jgi:hypothetical protein
MSLDRIRIVKNCVSQQFVDFIDKELTSTNLQWGYSFNVTNNANKEAKPGFSNSPFADNTILNTSYWFLYPLLLEAANKNGFFVERLLRIRIGAYLNRNTKEPNNIHTDSLEPHIVALYYPHDSDGETVFFDSMEGKNEILRITPERGTIVFFDGSIPHSSSNPVEHDIRITVNYNFIGNWPK